MDEAQLRKTISSPKFVTGFFAHLIARSFGERTVVKGNVVETWCPTNLLHDYPELADRKFRITVEEV